ncbi:uncharacterized protein PRCAT00002972001 [Priceomyces carsonii]|uniref:uncharacterized protein n=1 Tax=Priceomyces carsonii TaxID=28549 RepID=UPI002ED893CB|nr:unnamed protein product [Priceomyces carsonii]
MASDEKEVMSANEKEVDTFTDVVGADTVELLSSERNTKWNRLKGVIWDSLDKSPEERRFIFKVDCWVMTYVCVSYFVKYLDSMNTANAYVSGMKEDLNFHGIQYNWLSTWYYIGYIIGQVPSQIAISYIRPSIWLPANEILYAAFVMAMAGAKDVKTLYAFRFFIGLFESTAYVGIMTLLSNFYLPDELGKRTCIFQTSSSAAQMFSGYLQTGLYNGMNGNGGLAAWRWLFIFDGVITIPVAIAGFFVIPDDPLDSKAFWFKANDKKIALERLKKSNRNTKPKMKFNHLLDMLKDWPIYLFSAAFCCHVVGIRLYSYMNLWLQEAGFSVSKTNILPTVGYAIQIVCTLCWAWLSDGFGSRWSVIVLACSTAIIGSIILWVWPNKNSGLFAGWYLLFCETGAGALFIAWMSETLSTAVEQRYLIIGVVETTSFILSAAVPLYLYPADEAPHYRYAYPVTFMFFTLEAVLTIVIAYIQRLENKGILVNKHFFEDVVDKNISAVEEAEVIEKTMA